MPGTGHARLPKHPPALVCPRPAACACKAPDIPSVLVETAFVSNPEEEARLRDPSYQARMADSLHRGIQDYFSRNPPLARSRTV